MTESGISVVERRFLVAVLGFILVLVGADLVTDSLEGVHWSHLIAELAVALAAGAAFLVLLNKSFQKSHELNHSREVIQTREQEVKRWREESEKFVHGLSAAIDAQMARWSLTVSEKDIALLLLKGLSLKEIAEIRKTVEKTVRTQSTSIYAKAGLAGRSELAAFFLEDLLIPTKSFSTSAPK